MPIGIAGHRYDPETIGLLRSILDEIWTELTEVQRNRLPRSLLAERLLQVAATGERDRGVLRSHALDDSARAGDGRAQVRDRWG